MATVRSQYVRNSLVFYEGHRHRVVDAIGKNVKKYELRPDHLNADTSDPTGWTSTVVEVGAGTTEFSPNDSVDRVGTITTAANENDGGNYQLLGEMYQADGSRDIYVGMECQINDADQTDIFFGLAVTDTTLLGGVTDGIYLESLDGAATISSVTEKDSTETQNDSLGTITDATDFTIELYYSGADDTVYFYVDGSRVATHTANIPDDEALRLSLHFLTGEAVANTCNIKWLRAFQIS